VGVAVCKARAQVRRFEVEELDAPAPRPRFTGGDPRLVEAIEAEMLEGVPRVEWDSIGGLHSVKQLLNEAVVLPLLIPDFFTGLRAPWKGVLLFGPPGTGKTLLARAVASVGRTRFFHISASSLVSKFHGESERLGRTLFAMARHYAPSVVFFDEVDALLGARGGSGEHEASRRLKSELLSQMDGVPSAGGERVLVLATSNTPWALDEAMRRRLERRIYVPLPDEAARREVLAAHTRGVKLAEGVELDALARESDGYSGADLHVVCRDAAMMTMRKAVEGKSAEQIVALKEQGLLDGEITAEDFREAMRRTPPSVGSEDVAAFERWNSEFGAQ